VVQQARKDEDLVVTDRIAVAVDAPDRITDAVRAHEATVRAAVLATDLTFGAIADGASVHEAKVEGDLVRVAIRVTV
jgi:isoleucyl-tRNA synthetase